MKKFIRTTDADTAAQLRKLGFQEVFSGDKNAFLFINERMTFAEDSNIDKKDIVYTDTLFM